VSDYTLVAFGGCGGLHAASLATAVGMRRVVVPPLAGVLSCVGLLWAPVEMSVTETVALPLSDSTVPTIYAIVNRLAVEQQELLDATLEGADSPSPSAATRGGSTTKTDVIVNADLRYPGEGSELTLPLTATGFDLAAAADLARTFQRRHVEIFGHGDAGPIEVVRIRATARRSAAPIDPISAGIEVCHEDVRRTARFNDGIHEVPVVSRSALHDMADGPLLIDEADTTTVVPPGWRAHCDDTGNLILVAS
jgi:N-methylhydantoinase A